MPKVSVVIPVFCVEQYIGRCARSLFEQTLDDMEFVFVDDCTRDGSVRVLENVLSDYPNRAGQVKILRHPVNKGLSRARETGVKHACGDYIAHCDSDDWVATDMYEKMYGYAVENNCDFVKSGYRITDGVNEMPVSVFMENGDLSQRKVIGYLLRLTGWNTIWNTLAKRDLYNGISYTDDMMLEDLRTILQVIVKSKNVGVLDEPFYRYFSNPESICRLKDVSSVVRRAKEAERNVNEAAELVRGHFGEMYEKEIAVMMSAPRMLLYQIMGKYCNYNAWNSVTPGITKNVLLSPYLNLTKKLWYLSVETRLYPVWKSFMNLLH